MIRVGTTYLDILPSTTYAPLRPLRSSSPPLIPTSPLSANILLNGKCEVRIADLGMARALNPQGIGDAHGANGNGNGNGTGNGTGTGRADGADGADGMMGMDGAGDRVGAVGRRDSVADAGASTLNATTAAAMATDADSKTDVDAGGGGGGGGGDGDGGDAASRSSQHATEYVVTRWYRAPELLFAYGVYEAAIDTW